MNDQAGRQEADTQPVAALYSELQPQLTRILSSNLQPPDWVIEEACQSAWSSLLQHRGLVRAGGELGWLSTTATRTALRLLRRDPLVEACEELPEADGPGGRGAVACDPQHSVELRERLAEVRSLPVRQQRMLWLHGFGYEYGEIAAVTGDTRRTVARQLTRARQRLLRIAEEQPGPGPSGIARQG